MNEQEYALRATAKAKRGDLKGAIADMNAAIALDSPKMAACYAKRGMYRYGNAKSAKDSS